MAENTTQTKVPNTMQCWPRANSTRWYGLLDTEGQFRSSIVLAAAPHPLADQPELPPAGHEHEAEPIVGTAVYRINTGGPSYTDSLGQAWLADEGFNAGNVFETGATISNTDDPTLFQSERWGTQLLYSLPVPGELYRVTLYFADIFPGTHAVGARVFDVEIGGHVVFEDVDIFAEVGGLAALVKTADVHAHDGVLEIKFLQKIQNPKISAIEVHELTPAPTTYRINTGGASYTDSLGQKWLADEGFNAGNVFTTQTPIAGTNDPTLFQSERWGGPLLYNLAVPDGSYQVNLYFADIFPGTHAVGARVFDVELQGQVVFEDVDIFAEVGGFAALVKTADVQVDAGQLEIKFLPKVDNPKISAIEVFEAIPHDHFLHVVIRLPPNEEDLVAQPSPTIIVDYDQDGTESITLDGTDSHTHELGRALASFEWSEMGLVFGGNSPVVTQAFSLGLHPVALTIADDDTSADTLSETIALRVVAPDDVPGSLVLYYQGAPSGAASLLDAVPANAEFGEVQPGLIIGEQNGVISNTPFAGDVMVRFLAQLDISESGTYHFQNSGGSESRLFLDGNQVNGPMTLGAGRFALEARFAVNSLVNLPLEVTFSRDIGPQEPVVPDLITHDERSILPVMNTAPDVGSTVGGEQIDITGLGFFPSSQVTVHWGSTLLSGGDFLAVTPQLIRLQTPPGTVGTISLTVETPNGQSNSLPFAYQAGIVPIHFVKSTVASMTNPTQGAWGPDGRLYVGALTGEIKAYTFDDDYNVIDTQTITTVVGLSNKNILGIAFNPFDPPGTVRIYVAHSLLFANGGLCFDGFSPYSGQVSVLEGPTFSVLQPLVTGLPVSNHDHGINGLQFDHNGDLLMAVGGNTNAGVQACNSGGLPESPLSGAILKAEVSKPNFNGQIVYIDPASGQPNDDQVFGDRVVLAPGVDVSVFASGFRNAFDLVFTTRGLIYCTDNGPNLNFGPASTSATTQGPEPAEIDKLCLVKAGHYYGHPNRNRGKSDARQNVYHGLSENSIPGTFTQPLGTFISSTNGIDEYRASTFQGAMRGELIAQKLNGSTFRIKLSPDGESVESIEALPSEQNLGSLSVVTGPGGVIFGINYDGNQIQVNKPVDAVASGLVVYDIFPWRAPASGGHRFVIGGSGFGDLGNTTVSIAGLSATLMSVSPTRIVGIVPLQPSPSTELVTVEVSVGSNSTALPDAFLYLPVPGIV
jgi:glucose/arabinose dehydrogenase